PHHLAGTPHSVQSEDGVFEIIVAQSVDRLSEADGLLGGPDRVRVEPHRVLGKGGRQRAVGFELVVRGEYPGLQLVRAKPEPALGSARELYKLIGSADLTCTGPRIGISPETIRGERHRVAQPSAEDVADPNAPLLTQDVQTGELDRCQK